MNHNITPETEYEMMQQFFQSGGTIETMPDELLRVRKIWLHADRLVRKYPYYNNEKIAKQLIADLPEFNLALSTAKNHVTYAKKYFDFVETESPQTHRRILTEICYKQIAILERQQLQSPRRAHLISKIIEHWSNRIASINHLYEKEKQEQFEHGDITLIISDDDLKFPDLKSISDKELFKIIDKVAEEVEITTAEKQQIIEKDVNGKLI